MLKIGLIFGGLSNEHEVSINSAKNIVKNFDYNKYKLVLIYWKRDGRFYVIEDINNLKNKQLIAIEAFKQKFDISLLMTHGKYGEDGVLQAILESQKIKYCGCKVLSSALCMDKAIFKQFAGGQKFPQVKFEIIADKFAPNEINAIKKMFKLPVFVKPANSGSSVGITKVKDFAKLKLAIKEAFKHDSKVIIEQGIEKLHEIEVAILGNEKLIISEPGEVLPFKEFYDYDDKYILNKTKLIIPAKLNRQMIFKIKEIAGKIYKLCDCSGFARIDFLIKNNKVYLNEINTLPGFTQNSMYPLLMMNSGISYKELINKIIELSS
ncbi:MAG: D-alanine--D-alanine ligase [Candidatus Parcubacteria bacterium]|nr:D-alanine--D-alanine ligase [Candidatus Parcubacteria bacterium]